jgi:hypothetical protein
MKITLFLNLLLEIFPTIIKLGKMAVNAFKKPTKTNIHCKLCTNSCFSTQKKTIVEDILKDGWKNIGHDHFICPKCVQKKINEVVLD